MPIALQLLSTDISAEQIGGVVQDTQYPMQYPDAECWLAVSHATHGMSVGDRPILTTTDGQGDIGPLIVDMYEPWAGYYTIPFTRGTSFSYFYDPFKGGRIPANHNRWLIRERGGDGRWNFVLLSFGIIGATAAGSGAHDPMLDQILAAVTSPWR